MNQQLYSIRMHSRRAGDHLSGAENLVGLAALESTAALLVRRALQHSRGAADQLRLVIDLVDPDSLEHGCLPDLRTLQLASVAEARRCAGQLLAQVGVTTQAVAAAMQALVDGAAPGGRSMRGAMLIDCRTGERLEADRARGVRVSRIGMTGQLDAGLTAQLEALDLNNLHVREALLLAGKVAMHRDILAELCWSDDPDYTAGYVSSRHFGYLRFPQLKPSGETRGGRAFFLRPGSDLAELTTWLESAPVLFERAGTLYPPVGWREYATFMGTATG